MDDLISRQAAIELVNRHNTAHMKLKGIPMLGAAVMVTELNALPSAHLQLCEDAVSRKAVIDGCLCNGTCTDEGRWCDDGDCPPVRRIKALPAIARSEVCEDAVSLQTMLNDLESQDPTLLWDAADIGEWLYSLPLVQPNLTFGTWEYKEARGWECNRCGCLIKRYKPLSGNTWNYYFCPNCGADMRGEQNEKTD